MSYARSGPFTDVPQSQWASPPVGAVALSAAALNHIEDGLVAVASQADVAQAGKVGKGDLVINVRDKGAVGDGTTDDTAAFASALAGGNVYVYVPAGSYRITASLRLQANTWLTMHPAATLLNDNTASNNETVFINGPIGNATYATGYTGDGNIRVTGGTVDCARRSARQQISQAFAIAHAENVLIEGVNMLNCYAGHFIEYNAVRNGVIRGCTFTNMNPGASTNRDAINIDYAFQSGFPYLGAWDNTVCENILVEACVFTSIQTGVASHSAPPLPHRNIRVRDCVFTTASSYAVHGMNWRGGYITGNRLNSCAGEGIRLESGSVDVAIRDNELVDIGTGQAGFYSAVNIADGSGCRVGPNRITTTAATPSYLRAYLLGGSGHVLNTAGADPGTNGFAVTDNGTWSIIDGAYGLTIADQAAASVLVPGTNSQGMVLISTQSTATQSARGLYWVRCAGTVTNVAIAAAAAANVTLTTGVALTGTTGTAGNLTISANSDGRLYIENRSGTVKRVAVQFIAG